MPVDPRATGLLEYWFADCYDQAGEIADRMPFWFGEDIARDTQMAIRFSHVADLAANGDLPHWEVNAASRLALILALDQLPRNLYRSTAQAFRHDKDALALCVEGNRLGMDVSLTLIERVFFWMPLQHAEDRAMQELGVRLYRSLAQEDPANFGLWNGFADYASRHRDIIREFGRFPHRNEVLGRQSTEAERAYLEGGGDTFGQ